MKRCVKALMLAIFLITLTACVGSNYDYDDPETENYEYEDYEIEIDDVALPDVVLPYYPAAEAYDDIALPYYPEIEIEPEPIVLDFSYALAQVCIRRQGIAKPGYNELLALTGGRVPGALPDILFDHTLPNRTAGRRLAVSQATEDIETFFAAMRNAYAGYEYFGGDAVFLPIKEAIMAELYALGGGISLSTLQNVLVNHLSPIINDNHFFIQPTFLSTPHFISVIDGLFYDRSTNGFNSQETGLYLKAVEGHEIEEIMQLHANIEGGLFYRPVLRGDMVFGEPIYFTYENGESIARQFQLYRPQSRPMQLPTLELHNGIPIISVQALGFDGNANGLWRSHAVTFMPLAEQVRYEPAIIIDLRSNQGGNGILPKRWLYALTGEIVPSNFVQLATGGAEGAEASIGSYRFSNPESYSVYFTNFREFGENYRIAFDLPDRVVEREQVLIVLTCRLTASAGEVFVDLAASMSNTLIIGSPTSGTLAFSGSANMHLPNSGLLFRFGRAMMVWPDGHFAEGAGIQPDIWADGDALAVALALLRDAGFGD